MADSAFNLTNNPDTTRIPWTAVTNVIPMINSTTTVPSEAQAYMADLAVLGVANSKTAVRFWDAGTFQNGTPNTGDMIVFTDTASTTSGNATFYITSDHTSSGTALCSSILTNSLNGVFVDSSGNYNKGLPTVTSNKTIVVPSTKQTASGVTVVGITVIGTVTYPASPNATTTLLFGIGISV